MNDIRNYYEDSQKDGDRYDWNSSTTKIKITSTGFSSDSFISGCVNYLINH